MATSLDVLAIDDTDEQLKLIGKGSSYDKRNEFETTIRDVAEETQRHFQQRIVDMDSNQHSHTFNGGFDAVVRLCTSHLTAPNNGI